MVKIRIEGTPEECQQATPKLAQLFDVVSISDPYPNRSQSRLVRVYVELRLAEQRQVDQDNATGAIVCCWSSSVTIMTSNRPSSPSGPATQLALRTLTRRVCSLAPGMARSQSDEQ
jgi:hypothetical protein